VLSVDKLSSQDTFSILLSISLHSPSIKQKFVIHSPWNNTPSFLSLFTAVSLKDSLKPQATTKQIANTKSLLNFTLFCCFQEHAQVNTE